jgi:hypothetical protein
LYLLYLQEKRSCLSGSVILQQNESSPVVAKDQAAKEPSHMAPDFNKLGLNKGQHEGDHTSQFAWLILVLSGSGLNTIFSSRHSLDALPLPVAGRNFK